jgi:hypothetical protein
MPTKVKVKRITHEEALQALSSILVSELAGIYAMVFPQQGPVVVQQGRVISAAFVYDAEQKKSVLYEPTYEVGDRFQLLNAPLAANNDYYIACVGGTLDGECDVMILNRSTGLRVSEKPFRVKNIRRITHAEFIAMGGNGMTPFEDA